MGGDWTVQSCSSESPVHKAENVTVGELYRIWQTNEPSEEAWLVLHTDTPKAIESLEIVNAGTSLLELYGLPEDAPEGDDNALENYELLLSTQQVMTLKDLTNKSNRNRSFTYTIPQKLSPVSAQKRWKRLRIICRQPFGTSEHRACIGLSRINVITCKTEVDAKSDVKKRKLPSWSGTSENPVENSQPKIIENVSPSKEKKGKRLSASAGDAASDSRHNHTGKDPHSMSKGSILSRDEIKPNSSSSPNTTAGEKKHEDSNNRKKPTKANIKVSSPSSGGPMSGSTAQEEETGHGMLGSHNKPDRGSFSCLMEGIVIAISGLVNPERGNLRSQALEMGAEYQPDWNPKCTLLVCAFPNTPKFKQVKGDGGTIVSKEWITECYKKKKLVDIDRYLMHAGKPWKKMQSLNVSNESDNYKPLKSEDNIISGEKPRQTKKKVQLEGRSVSARNEKARNIDAKSTKKLDFNPSDVQKWVVEDLNATESWLQEQEEKPQPNELEETAMQGILACLEDATQCLKENKGLHNVLDVWEFVPRAVKQLAVYEDLRRGSQTISREELCKRADTVKNIYETEFKKLKKMVKKESDRQSSGVLHRSNKSLSENIGETGDNDHTMEAIPNDASKDNRDYDSDDTIVMDEDELDQAEAVASKNDYSKI